MVASGHYHLYRDITTPLHLTVEKTKNLENKWLILGVLNPASDKYTNVRQGTTTMN